MCDVLYVASSNPDPDLFIGRAAKKLRCLIEVLAKAEFRMG